MLTPEQIEEYKKILEASKIELSKELVEDSRPDDFGDEGDSEDEETDEAEDLANKAGAVNITRERINRIDSALLRIDSGEFGKCSKCGSEISIQVLDLIPESNLCENCK